MSSYINHGKRGGYKGELIHDWQDFTRRRLLWLYEDVARAYGTDPKSKADLAAWNSLGRRDAA